jgi:hypothetical protein
MHSILQHGASVRGAPSQATVSKKTRAGKKVINERGVESQTTIDARGLILHCARERP